MNHEVLKTHTAIAAGALKRERHGVAPGRPM
jgi:hypothetical protein